MKGVFRNGFFHDEDGPQEQRNIQYDLDPEKMEKIWVREMLLKIIRYPVTRIIIHFRRGTRADGRGLMKLKRRKTWKKRKSNLE